MYRIQIVRTYLSEGPSFVFEKVKPQIGKKHANGGEKSKFTSIGGNA